jgi:uncharacterized protein (TIGR00369 family)
MPKKPHGRGHGLPDTRLRKNQCFACGPDNLAGMHLKFKFDKKRKTFVCRFRLDDRYTGPPGHCHGGIIATILDEAMGKVNKLRRVVALTSNMTVDYLRPVPLNKPLRVESREVSTHGRKHVNMGEIMNGKGDVLARGQALFISVDAERMFAKFVEKR